MAGAADGLTVSAATNERIVRALSAAVEGGEAVVLATIVETRRSVPRHAGTKMLVFADGETIGTVGGGEMEAKAVAALSHPNILAIHDVGENRGLPFLVSELLQGESLRERINSGSLTPRKAVSAPRLATSRWW